MVIYRSLEYLAKLPLQFVLFDAVDLKYMFDNSFYLKILYKYTNILCPKLNSTKHK